jgi:hypothetical protein
MDKVGGEPIVVLRPTNDALKEPMGALVLERSRMGNLLLKKGLTCEPKTDR